MNNDEQLHGLLLERMEQLGYQLDTHTPLSPEREEFDLIKQLAYIIGKRLPRKRIINRLNDA